MDPQGRALGPATTRFGDYVGTVAADDAEAVMDRPSLYELAQIDRDRYTIVGIELNVDGPTTGANDHFQRVPKWSRTASRSRLSANSSCS